MTAGLETKALETAFEQQLAFLWGQMMNAFASAGENAQQEAAAAARFRSGVILARRVYEQALKQLG